MEKVKLPDELMKEKMRKRRLFLYDSMTEQERLEYDRADAEVQVCGLVVVHDCHKLDGEGVC